MKKITGVAINFGALPPYTAGVDVVLTDPVTHAQVVERMSLVEFPKDVIDKIRELVEARAPLMAQWGGADGEESTD